MEPLDFYCKFVYRRVVGHLFLKIRSMCGEEMENIIKFFIEKISLEKSKKTTISYLFDLLIGLRFFKCKNQLELEQLKVQDFRALCAQRREEGISIASQQRMIIAWKLFLKSLEINTIQRFKIPKVPKRHPRPVMEEAISKIIDLDGNWQVLRNKALWLTMYGSGMRISEALNLKCEDIDDKVLLIRGKGESSRLVPLLPKVVDFIKEYLAQRPFDSKWLFISGKGKRLSQQNAAQIFRRWADKNDLDDWVTLHSMRHGFASHLLEKGCSLPGIQKLLGHSQVSTTSQYIEVKDKQLHNKLLQLRGQFRANI